MREHRLVSTAQNVRTMLSRQTIVQANLRAGSEQEALDRIYIHSARDDGTENPPRIILSVQTLDWEWAVGFNGTVDVMMSIQLPIPTDEQGSRTTEYEWFTTQVEDIIDAMQAGVRGGGELAVDGLTMELDYLRDEELPAGHTERHVWEAIGSLRVAV